jgi:hypothetical protein
VRQLRGAKTKPAAKRQKSAAHGSSRGLAAKEEPAPQGRKNQTPNGSVRDLQIIAIPLTAEIKPGDSLAEKFLQSLRQRKLRFERGDILIVKHKVVSKAEGRIVDLETITPSDESIAWAKKYNLDPRVIELALRESRAVTASFAPTAASMSLTSMAANTRCFCLPTPTAPRANFTSNSESAPHSPSPFSSPILLAAPGAKAWSISVSASPV